MITCWGDSLTAGTGSTAGNDFPSVLARLTGQTVTNRGVGGDTSTQIRARYLADTAHRTDTQVWWIGTNNSYDPNTIIVDADAMVAALGHTRFVFAGPTTRPSEYLTADPSDPHVIAHNVAVAAGLELAVRYQGHYVDLRAALVRAYNPGIPQDVTDHALDVPPSSLRCAAQGADNDGNGKSTVHLNDAGYAVVASAAATLIRARGMIGRVRDRVVATPSAGETIAVFMNGGVLQNRTVVNPSTPDDAFAKAEALFVKTDAQ